MILVSKAFRLPAQIGFLAYPDCILIDFIKSVQQKHPINSIFANQHGSLKCGSNHIPTDVSWVWRWRLFNLIVRVSWWTRRGARGQHILTNVLWGIKKSVKPFIIKCLKNNRLPPVTALFTVPNLLLHSKARHDCSTDQHNVHPFVLLLSLSGAANFGIAIWQRKNLINERMCLHFFHLLYFRVVKLHHQLMYWCLLHYHRNLCRLVSKEQKCLARNPIWSLANDSADTWS